MIPSIKFRNYALSFLVVLLGIVCSASPLLAQNTSEQKSSRISYNFVNDGAGIVSEKIKNQINQICNEIENNMRIRVLIKTETLEDLTKEQDRVESFFSEWIRSIGLDKRGILIYALLPEGSAHGKVHLRVGIGLKYLITREMGEKILNQVILPNNSSDNDGLGFLQGVTSIKRMLLDELKREGQRKAAQSTAFNLQSFIWASKEILLALLVALFLIYVIFFVERCPRCNGALKVSVEPLKEPGENTLGLRRRIYVCERCGFSRRKKEPVYPPGKAGLIMRLTGTRRNVKINK
ncbi:MAG: TPM domain-containing protein [Candidatus Rifleibacteriota bacterium]